MTRPVVLDVTTKAAARIRGAASASALARPTKIKRSDFGLTWNEALETGGFLVGDEVKISLDVEAVKA